MGHASITATSSPSKLIRGRAQLAGIAPHPATGPAATVGYCIRLCPPQLISVRHHGRAYPRRPSSLAVGRPRACVPQPLRQRRGGRGGGEPRPPAAVTSAQPAAPTSPPLSLATRRGSLAMGKTPGLCSLALCAPGSTVPGAPCTSATMHACKQTGAVAHSSCGRHLRDPPPKHVREFSFFP